MIKLLKNIVLLLLLTVLADRLIGMALEALFYKQHHGDDYITIEVLDSTKADILVAGSSRASHHYISDTLERYTGLTVFNGGRDNMGIHYTEATIREMLKRHRPKYVVLDIIPYNFINDNQNNPKYFEVQTSVLLPFAHRHQGLYEAIGHINRQEVWKSKGIKTYAYNSLIGSILQNSFTHIGHKQIKGYEPLSGNIDAATYGKQVFAFPSISKGIDTGAFGQLKACLKLCDENHVNAIICFSPFYFPYHHEEGLMDEFRKAADLYHATIFDYSADTTFVMQPQLFYDELHLNDQGAVLFSKKLAAQVVALSK